MCNYFCAVNVQKIVNQCHNGVAGTQTTGPWRVSCFVFWSSHLFISYMGNGLLPNERIFLVSGKLADFTKFSCLYDENGFIFIFCLCRSYLCKVYEGWLWGLLSWQCCWPLYQNTGRGNCQSMLFFEFFNWQFVKSNKIISRSKSLDISDMSLSWIFLSFQSILSRIICHLFSGYLWRGRDSLSDWWNHWDTFSRFSLCNSSLRPGIFPVPSPYILDYFMSKSTPEFNPWYGHLFHGWTVREKVTEADGLVGIQFSWESCSYMMNSDKFIFGSQW